MRLKGKFIVQLFDPAGGGSSVDGVSLDEIKEFILSEKPKEPVVKKTVKKSEAKKDEK